MTIFDYNSRYTLPFIKKMSFCKYQITFNNDGGGKHPSSTTWLLKKQRTKYNKVIFSMITLKQPFYHFRVFGRSI